MRTSARVIVFVLVVAAFGLAGFGAAFGLATAEGADPGTTVTSSEPQPTTEPTTTEPTTTEPAPTTQPPAAVTRPRRPAPIPFGVTVGGVKIGGRTPSRAAALVEKSFARPLALVVDASRRIDVAPGTLGARANVTKAVRRARLARPGAALPLDVSVPVVRVRAYVDRLGRRLDVEPRDARLVLKGVRPLAMPSRVGRYLKQAATARAIRTQLAINVRKPLRLPFVVLRPEVRSADFDQAIVIMRGSNELLLFDDVKLIRRFPVATGQKTYPTPLGTYEIVTMQRNPWWYPPPSPWAEDEQPVPPGPGNPLGTRWMGLSAPYVGIHGTPNAASIGYSASHGCIRMRIPDAEWLFQHVEVGTPVFIVAR